MRTALALEGRTIHLIFRDCLLKDEENHEPHVIAQGVGSKTNRFHTARLETHRSEIHDLLSQLPAAFMRSGGGGAGTNEMHLNCHGDPWTRLPEPQDELVQLGNAIGEIEFQQHRPTKVNRGVAVPYFVVNQ